MSKHTPGPLYCGMAGRSVYAIENGNIVKVAEVDGLTQEALEARLIAAAPQLLDRLKALVAAVKRGEVLEHHVTSADAAIDAAEKGVEG